MESRTFHVTMTRADYAAGMAPLVAQVARSDKSRGRMLFARLGVVCIAVAVVIAWFPHSIPGILAACVVAWLGEMLITATIKGQPLSLTFDPLVHSDLLIGFDAEGITERSAVRCRGWSWDAVRRLHRTGAHLILEMAGWEAIVLPATLWDDPSGPELLARAIEERTGLAELHRPIPSSVEATAHANLTEPTLLARMAIAAAAFHLLFESGVRMIDPSTPLSALGLLGLSLAAAAASWPATGAAFRALTRRSARAALVTAWSLFALLGAAFLLNLRTG